MTQLSKQDIQNIDLLKQQALSVIQTLAGEAWSDHNRSDPGITILEVLAVVIHDLSNRLALPIEDLVAHHPKFPHSPQAYQTPEQLLASNAVTLNDYRRLFLNVQGVKGADVRRRSIMQSGQEVKSGLYDVIIDFNDAVSQGSIEEVSSRKSSILTQVRQRFLMQRNVNEDIASIKTVKKFPVTVSLSLSLGAAVDPLTVITKIFKRIKDTVSPTITRYQYSQLLNQGLSGDEIFQGPVLSQGFILDKDLKHSSLPESLYSSDILSAVEDIEGLKTLKGFKFISSEEDDGDLLWRLVIPENRLVKFNLLESFKHLQVEVDGHHYQLPNVTEQDLIDLLDVPVTTIGNGAPVSLSDYVNGQHHQLGHYTSLQHQLPKLYALAEQRLDNQVISKETASILQLKGYLSLFDQVLADQFAQLELLKELLAMPNQGVFRRLAQIFKQMLSSEALTQKDIAQFSADILQLPMTRFSQPLQDISGMGRLLGDYFSEYTKRGFQTISEPAFSEVQLDRLKRSCEHLFSRFAETTLDASLLKYREAFSHYLPVLEQSELISQFPNDQPLLHKLVSLKQVVDLVLLLNDYPDLSTLRTGGFNYLSTTPKSRPYSGLLKRLMAFLGIDQPAQLPMATKNQEGVYLLESELLRFGLEESNDHQTFQLYFVAPAWPTRFSNSEFRALLERQIVKDSPVHQQPHIVYLNREDMSLFERLYFAWLNAMTQLPLTMGELGEVPRTFSIKEQQNLALIEILSDLLRQFSRAPEKLSLLILRSLGHTQVKSAFNLWLKGPEETALLNGDDSEQLQKSLWEILVNRFNAEGHEQDSSQELAQELLQQITFTICQAQLDALTKPHPIKKAKIGENFRVGYSPLKFLKPSYPMGNGIINPQTPVDESSGLSLNQILLEQPVFTLGIKQPHSI